MLLKIQVSSSVKSNRNIAKVKRKSPAGTIQVWNWFAFLRFFSVFFLILDGGSHMIPSKDLLVVVAKTYQKQALQSSNSIQCHGEFITSDNLVFSIESRNALTFKQSR